MKKIILLTIVLFVGCATVTTNFNNPFIDHEETKLLEFGMSQNDAINKIGKPLFVDSGKNNKIVWVYDVRSITVQSKSSTKGDENKTNSSVKHGDIIHQLALVFENGKVLSWGDYAGYDPNHKYGFYSDCYPSAGCTGDVDECGNCQPPVVEDDLDSNGTGELLTPKCCGDNLYLIDDDGNVTNGGDK